jgi:hypothetical protein
MYARVRHGDKATLAEFNTKEAYYWLIYDTFIDKMRERTMQADISREMSACIVG